MNNKVFCVASDSNYQENSIALINSVLKNNNDIDIFYRFVNDTDLNYDFNNNKVKVLNDKTKLNTKKTFLVQGFDIANETYKNINNRLVSEKLLYCVHAKYLNVLEMLKEDYEYIIISDADMIVRKSLKKLINEIDNFDILFKHGFTSNFYANKFKLPSKTIYEEGFFIVKNNSLVKDFFTKLVNIIEKSKKEGTYHLDIDTFEVVNLVHNSNNIKVGELKYIFKDFNLKEESIVWSGQSGNKNSEKFKNEQSKYIS
jgi:hypothetical protein